MKFLLVVNPHSGKKQGNEILAMVKPIFDRAGIELTIIETVFPGHARELATRIELAEFDGLLTLGGDGTFHEIVNGIFNRRDGNIIPLGIIPGGSGNSFLRDFGLTDPIRAVEAIVNGHTRSVDVARIEMNQIVRYSINLIGWGLVTDVGKRAEVLRWLGPSRYTISSIIEIFGKKDRPGSLIVDNQTFSGNFTFVVACNSIHIGKGMKMAPNARLDDGLIDLVIVEGNITRRRLLSVLPKLFDGTHVNEPEVTYKQASSFSLIPETDDDLNIDGEMVGTTPISVTMLPNALDIFA